MGPFGGKRAADRLAAASKAGASPGGTEVSVLTTITSASEAVSPFTGMRAALIYLELLERLPDGPQHHPSGFQLDPQSDDVFTPIGAMVFGDLLTLQDADGDEITVVTRRARIVPALRRRTGTPIERVPEEVVHLLANSSGRDVVCYYELCLRAGDEIKLTAWVEPTHSVVSAGDRSGARVTYVARDDRDELVLLEELLETPAF